MNLIEFNRAVLDEIEKITRDIKWPEIENISCGYMLGSDRLGVFILRLGSHNRTIQQAITRVQVEMALFPIIAYTVDRSFDMLRTAEMNYAKEKHNERRGTAS